MTLPAPRDWLFALKTYASGMLALYVALRLDLPRPYWAVLTAFIVAQPLSGMVQSKAAYRVIGTVGGAAFAVLAVPNLVAAPELLSLALALWVGACLYVSLLDRTPRAYAFMLAGYTAAIVGFPSVGAPEDIFTTALSRSEEITLGILCATFVDALVFPQPVGAVLAKRLDALLEATARWGRGVLDGQGGATLEARADRFRLIGDANALSQLRVHAIYDTPSLRAARGWVYELERRMHLLHSVLFAIEDRTEALARSAPERLDGVRPLLKEVAAWIDDPDDAGEAARLRSAIAARTPDSSPPAWDDLLLASLLARLADLVDLWGECRTLRARIAAGERSPSGIRAPALHRDPVMARISGLAAACGTLLTCSLWIVTAWPDGGTAATMTAVLCCLFASADDPAPFALTFLLCTLVAAVIAGVYLFAVLPAVDGFPLLALSLAVVVVPAAVLMPNPAYFPYALPILINTSALMSLQSAYTADFGTYLNGAVGQIVGMGIAVVVLRLMRSAGSARVVSRLAAAARDDLARLATGDAGIDRPRFAARAFDRIAALAPRLREAEPGERRRTLNEALADLRVGLNLVQLREGLAALPPRASRAVSGLMDDLARNFHQPRPLTGGLAPSGAPLLRRIDETMAATAGPGADALPVLLALTGVRRALFPDASAPTTPGAPLASASPRRAEEVAA